MSNTESIFIFSIIISFSIIFSQIKFRKPFEKIPLLFSLIFLGFFVAFRGELTGTDTDTYRNIFSNINDPSKRVFENMDPIYLYLMWQFKILIDDGGVLFQAINAIIQFTCLYYAWISTKLENFKPEYGLLVFIGLSSYLNYFNGMRAATGVTIGLVAFSFLLRNNHIIFYFLVLMGALIHKGLIFLIIIPFISEIRLSKKLLLCIWIFSFLFAFGNLRLFFLSTFIEYLGQISPFFNRGLDSFDISKVQIVKVVSLNILYYLLISWRSLKFEKLNKYLLNTFLFTVIFSNSMAGSGLVSRLILPFDAILTIALPYFYLNLINKEQHKLAINILMIISFLAIMRSIANDSNGILPLTLDLP